MPDCPAWHWSRAKCTEVAGHKGPHYALEWTEDDELRLVEWHE